MAQMLSTQILLIVIVVLIMIVIGLLLLVNKRLRQTELDQRASRHSSPTSSPSRPKSRDEIQAQIETSINKLRGTKIPAGFSFKKDSELSGMSLSDLYRQAAMEIAVMEDIAKQDLRMFGGYDLVSDAKLVDTILSLRNQWIERLFTAERELRDKIQTEK